MTKEEQEKVVDELGDWFEDRNNYYNGFLYQWRDSLTFDQTKEEREQFYWMLWKMVSHHTILCRLLFMSDHLRIIGRIPVFDE